MEAYRVRKQFQWDGWCFAPTMGENDQCKCQCVQNGERCTGVNGTGCICHDTICRCGCGIREDQYGGNIWLVEEGHPRKEHMVFQRFATYDASIPSVDELIKDDKYKRLLSQYMPKRGAGRPKVAA